MPSLSILTAALAAGTVVSALPARLSGSTFSVKQVRNDNFAGRNGPLALAKAYRKFNAPLPTDLEAAVASILADVSSLANITLRSTGSETTTPTEYDSEYLTPVSIGTPAQTLNLDFDTGSSDLWVFSSLTPSSSINGQSIYSPDKSSSAKELSGASWEISYGDGSSSSGSVYTDDVTIGGLTVSGQAVEAAKTVSSEFTRDGDNDGLLGLAFSSINTVTPTQQKTFFDNAKSELDAALFTADLKHSEPGKYNFGYIDDSAYTGSITYTSVDSSQGFWAFTSPAYAVGDGSKTSTSVDGIADTGTTLLLLPDSIVDDYYKAIDGAKYDSSQGGYVFPCSTTPPTFTFYVEDTPFTIPGDFMNYSPIDSSSCYGGLQSDSGIGISIYGDVALKATFVVFDDTPKLGFATKDL